MPQLLAVVTVTLSYLNFAKGWIFYNYRDLNVSPWYKRNERETAQKATLYTAYGDKVFNLEVFKLSRCTLEFTTHFDNFFRQFLRCGGLPLTCKWTYDTSLLQPLTIHLYFPAWLSWISFITRTDHLFPCWVALIAFPCLLHLMLLTGPPESTVQFKMTFSVLLRQISVLASLVRIFPIVICLFGKPINNRQALVVMRRNLCLVIKSSYSIVWNFLALIKQGRIQNYEKGWGGRSPVWKIA